MTDDITHNLTVVREALEAEGLGVHVKLIDAAIEEISGLREANHHYRDSAARDEKEIASLRVRLASASKALTEIAALSHRWKWEFDLSEDYKPTAAAARGLITKSFDALHRLGDQALKSRDSLTDENRDSK